MASRGAMANFKSDFKGEFKAEGKQEMKVPHLYSPTSIASEIHDWTELDAVEATTGQSDEEEEEKKFKFHEAAYGAQRSQLLSTDFGTQRSQYLSTDNVNGLGFAQHNTQRSQLLTTDNVDDRAPPRYEPTSEPAEHFAPGVPTEKASTSEHGTEPAAPALRRRQQLGPLPQFFFGSKMDKALPLQHNVWIKAGRHPKSQILLTDNGVSRNQLSFRWNHYQKKVELRNEAEGTLVNGKRVGSGERLGLDHGDLVRIMGKGPGKNWDFLLDLRPVGIATDDPRERGQKPTKDIPAQRRDRLKQTLLNLNKKVLKVEADTFEKEKNFYEVSTRRRLRLKEIAEREASLRFYVEDTKRLEAQLEEGRRRWQAKMGEAGEAHCEDVEPVIRQATALQEKLEKLTLKKDELVRSIHPERYAVADVTVNEVPHSSASLLDPSQPGGKTASGGATPKADPDNAFGDMRGLETPSEAPESDVELVGSAKKREAESAPAGSPAVKAPKVVDEDVEDLLGDAEDTDSDVAIGASTT